MAMSQGDGKERALPMIIGLAGAGLMGHGLGRNLLKHGHELRVIAHKKRMIVDDLVVHGAREVSSPEALAEGADILLLCLPGSREVETFVESLSPHLKAGQIIVDAGTSDPSSCARLAVTLQKIGVGFADAPMAGGPEQASAGETGVLVGASADIFTRIEPMLSCYAKTIAHMGDVGRGASAKLVSNYLVTGMISLIADCFAVAQAADVDATKLYEVMLAGSGNSGALRKMAGPALQGDFDGYKFALANAGKDIGYFVKMSQGLNALSPLAQEIEHCFKRALEKGDPQRNVSQLLRGSIG
jgi:3-hydroxyisobutyrate dehydrogenase-like beta-hydroxyacid dehydrogenase